MRVIQDGEGYRVLEISAEYYCGWEQSVSLLTAEIRHFRQNPDLDDVKLSRISNMRKPKTLILSQREALDLAHAILEDAQVERYKDK